MQEATQHFFGGGGETLVTSAALALVVLSITAILLLPRRFVCVPFLVAAVLVPTEQQVVFWSLHITMARILIMTAGLRLLGPALRQLHRLSAMDIGLLAYCLSNAVMFVILWNGNAGAVVNRCGFLINYLGAYWIMRVMLRTLADFERCVRTMSWVFIVIALGMTAERVSGRNMFAVIGGVPSDSVRRNGQIRAQGPFVHPLTAGTAGATMMPLVAGLAWAGKARRDKKARSRTLAFAGAAACFAVTGASMSSSAPLTLIAGLCALCLWPWRKHLGLLRWSAVAAVVVLHLFMRAPVWALVARIDLTGSSSGYHRYMLVDQFLRRFDEWWLVGTRSTEHWGPDMWDTINSYVAAGTSGGLLTCCLYIGLYIIGFGIVRAVSRRAGNEHVRWAWVLGCTLLAHSVSVFGIAYFDQSQYLWLFNLAALGSIGAMEPQCCLGMPALRTPHGDVYEQDPGAQGDKPRPSHAFLA